MAPARCRTVVTGSCELLRAGGRICPSSGDAIVTTAGLAVRSSAVGMDEASGTSATRSTARPDGVAQVRSFSAEAAIKLRFDANSGSPAGVRRPAAHAMVIFHMRGGRALWKERFRSIAVVLQPGTFRPR